MQNAFDLLLALSLAILEQVLMNEVVMLFIGVAVVCTIIGIILDLTDYSFGGRKR